MSARITIPLTFVFAGAAFWTTYVQYEKSVLRKDNSLEDSIDELTRAGAAALLVALLSASAAALSLTSKNTLLAMSLTTSTTIGALMTTYMFSAMMKEQLTNSEYTLPLREKGHDGLVTLLSMFGVLLRLQIMIVLILGIVIALIVG